MAEKNISVCALYDDRSTLATAVDALRVSGFRNTDISVLNPENEGTKDLKVVRSSKAPEGAVTGSICGALLGVTAASLLTAGVFVLPAFISYLTSAPWSTVLSGIGLGGVLGGLVGALFGLITPEYEAKRFDGRVRRGGLLLSVHCDNPDWSRRATKILKRQGGDAISRAQESPADFAKSDKPHARVREDRSFANDPW